MLSFVFYTACLISLLVFLQRFFATITIVSLPIIDAHLMGIGELFEDFKFDANRFFSIISEGAAGATRNSILLTLSSFITFTIYMVIIRLIRKKERNFKIEEADDSILKSINNLKNITKTLKLKYHSSRTFIRRKYIYISIHDLYLYINGNENIIFKIFHELSHKKSGDFVIGSLNKFLNKVLFFLLSTTYVYLSISLMEHLILLFLINTIGFTYEFYSSLTSLTIPLYPLISFYITYKIYNKYNIPSFFKECYSDRYAHILMKEKEYIYSNNIFNNSKSVDHPCKKVRISCANGISSIGNNLIKYFSIIFLLSIFPSLTNQEVNFFNFVQIILLLSYIAIIFCIYKVNIIITKKPYYLSTIVMLIFILIKFVVSYIYLFRFVNDLYTIGFINIVKSSWFIFQAKELLLLLFVFSMVSRKTFKTHLFNQR